MTTTRHWVIRAVLLAGACLVVTPSAAQQVNVGISGTGAVRFTDASALVCDATTEGSIRYEDASNRVEFCDDTVWTVLGPGGVGTIYVTDLADAVTDYVTDHNMRIGSNTAMFAGAANNLFIGESAGTAGTTNAADYNIAIGYTALDALTTGNDNVALGFGALTANQTGAYNIAIGRNALLINNGAPTQASSNVAIGYNSMAANTTGEANVVMGYRANDNPASGDADANVILGSNAGRFTSGDYNVAVGFGAFHDNTTGQQNVAIGSGALDNNTDGSSSVAVGNAALTGVIAGGTQNIALGWQAGDNITTGDLNVIIGYNIDAMSATGDSQLNIGDIIYGDLANDRIRIGGSGTVAAGPQLSVSNGATSAGAIGIYEDTDNGSNYASFTVPALAANTVYTLPADDGDAGEQLQTDGSGTLTWESAGGGGGGSIDGLSDATYDTGADHNMRIGSNTAMTAGAANNLFIGESSGTAGTTNAADNNIAVGYQSLDALTTGSDNVGIGVSSLSATTTQVEMTAVGARALANATLGDSNTAVGTDAIGLSGGGQYNTAVGARSLAALDRWGGDRNTAIGRNSGAGLTDGNNNVLAGDNALYASQNGYQNVVLGAGALYNASTSNNNVAIGYSVGGTLTTGDSNILIGQSVDVPANTTTSYLSIGNLIFATGGFGTDTTIGAGNVGIADSSPSTRLEVSGGFTITPASTVNLTADNQLVTVGNNSYIRVSSNNATPANRTFCLSAGTATGQHLIIEQIGSGFQAELEDSATPACAGDSPQSLTAAMTFNSLDDTVSLIWNGTSWLELARANN